MTTRKKGGGCFRDPKRAERGNSRSKWIFQLHAVDRNAPYHSRASRRKVEGNVWGDMHIAERITISNDKYQF